MLPDLNRVIEQVSKEKGIDRNIIIEAVKDAMLSAARRTYGPDKKLEAQYNPEVGEVELFETRIVVDAVLDPQNEVSLDEARRTMDPEAEVGDELLQRLATDRFGRIAAQTAKQNIIQRVRDAERDSIFNEFKSRKGELASGTVQRFEKKNLVVNLGRTDAILPEKHQIPRERYRQGDRIRAYIVDVELSSRGPQIILSRTHEGLLVKLFEQEVPEIYEGIVEVKGAAREPGGRAKFAVTSHDSDVDPVGACVGMRGTRVQAVVQELRNEKIDIVHWTPEPDVYVCRALAPARVSKIILDEDEHAMEVIVPDDQLSLAIGKKGQNVRLASKLTGWKLDVRSESEAEDEARRARVSLRAIPEVTDAEAELLYQDGFKSAEAIAASDDDTLGEVEGLAAERAARILVLAREHVAQLEAAREAAAVLDAGAEVPPPAPDGDAAAAAAEEPTAPDAPSVDAAVPAAASDEEAR